LRFDVERSANLAAAIAWERGRSSRSLLGESDRAELAPAELDWAIASSPL
jgi:hypothetical protein